MCLAAVVFPVTSSLYHGPSSLSGCCEHALCSQSKYTAYPVHSAHHCTVFRFKLGRRTNLHSHALRLSSGGVLPQVEKEGTHNVTIWLAMLMAHSSYTQMSSSATRMQIIEAGRLRQGCILGIGLTQCFHLGYSQQSQNSCLMRIHSCRFSSKDDRVSAITGCFRYIFRCLSIST